MSHSDGALTVGDFNSAIKPLVDARLGSSAMFLTAYSFRKAEPSMLEARTIRPRCSGELDRGVAWSGAAESALTEAFCFAGGPFPDKGLVLGRGSARFRTVPLGGPQVRKARSHLASPRDGADVFRYQDSTVAPVLDMRRRLKAVVAVFDGMLRVGVSLSVELTSNGIASSGLWSSEPGDPSLHHRVVSSDTR